MNQSCIHEPGALFWRTSRLKNSALEAALLHGTTPQLDDLAGWEFCGLNTSPWSRALRIRKFIKGFHRDETGSVHGYNIPVQQRGPSGDWQPKQSQRGSKRFGYYTVAPVAARSPDHKYLHALLLHYGQGGNPRLDPHEGSETILFRSAQRTATCSSAKRITR